MAQYIRYGGAAGAFTDNKAIRTYIATFLLTIPLNWFTRKLVGAPAEKMLSVAAIGLIVPPTLEGILMHWFPEFYGNELVMVDAGAVWLLFAIGIGLGLAALTSLRASARLRAGDRARQILTQNIEGLTVKVPDSKFGLTHVQFLRFAGCPVCNLHFEVISDPRRTFYEQYAVERSPFAILSPRAWLNLIRGYRLKSAGKIDSTTFGLPAEFLIDANGTIVASHYGEHSSDQWSVDDVVALAGGKQDHLPSNAPLAEGLSA